MYCAGKQKISESFVVDKFSNLVRTHFLQRCLDPIKSESNKVVGLEVSGEEETLYRLPGIVDKASLTWSEVWYRVIIGMIFIDFLFVCKKNPDLSRKRKKSHDDGPPAKRSKSEVEGEVQQMLTLQANQYKSEIIYQAHSKKVYCTCKVYQFMNIRMLNPKVLGLIHYTSHW